MTISAIQNFDKVIGAFKSRRLSPCHHMAALGETLSQSILFFKGVRRTSQGSVKLSKKLNKQNVRLSALRAQAMPNDAIAIILGM